MRGSWQVTRRKNVNFVITVCDAKYSAHPLFCLYIQVHVNVYALKNVKLEYEVHMNMTLTLLLVPCRCKWVWV